MSTKKTTTLLTSNEFTRKVLKSHYLKKWRKKLRKTKYLAYKKRFSIYQTDYSSLYNINNPFFFKNLFLNKSIAINYLLVRRLKPNLWVNNIVVDKTVTQLLSTVNKTTAGNTIIINWLKLVFKKNKKNNSRFLKISFSCKYRLKLKNFYNLSNLFMI